MKPDAIEVARRIKEIRTNLGYSMSQLGVLISNSPKTTEIIGNAVLICLKKIN